MHVLVTRRLTLRPPLLPDVEDIALHLSNPRVARMLVRVPHPYGVADAERWLESLAGRPEELVYTIHRERLIGVVSVETGEDGPRLGYWLGEPWHGRGFMTEAAGALLAYAFATRGYSAIRSSVFIDNEQSLRVQAKLGFDVTGSSETFSHARREWVQKWETRLTTEAFGAHARQGETRSAA